MKAKLDGWATLQEQQVLELREEIRELELRFFDGAPVKVERAERGIVIDRESKGEQSSLFEEKKVPQKVTRFVESSGSQKKLAAKVDEAAGEEKMAPEKGQLEWDLGRVWLVRVGVVLLVTGLVLLGNYAYRNWVRDLSAGWRLAGLGASGMAMCIAGWRCALRERTQAFGEVLAAGGMAFLYWCTYAAYHVPRLQVIDSPLLSTGALMVASGWMVGVSIRRDAQVTAVMGLLLAAYSTVLQPMSWLSIGSNLILAVAGVGLVRWKRWQGPGVAAMVGSYGAFFFWHVAGASNGAVNPASLAYPALLAGVFAIPTLWRGGLPGFGDYGRAWWIGINNAAGFGLFALTWIQLGYGEWWRVPLGWGGVWLAWGMWGRWRSRAMETYWVQGLVALSMAMVMKLEGYHLGLGLALEAVVMAGAFVRFGKWPELAFANLATVGAVVCALESEGISVGVLTAMALLLAGASFLLRCSRAPETMGLEKAGSSLVAIGAAGVGGCAWWQLPASIQSPVAMALAVGLSGVVLLRKWTEEAMEEGWIVLAWCVAALCTLMSPECRVGGMLLTMILGIIGCWLWERRGSPATEGFSKPVEWTASVAAWVHGGLAGLAAMGAILRFADPMTRFGWEWGLAVGWPTMAWYGLRCPRLSAVGGFALVLFLGDAVLSPTSLGGWIFGVPLTAWGLWRWVGSRGKEAAPGGRLYAWLARGVGCLGWCLAWHSVAKESWMDLLALSTLAGWWIWRRWLRAWKPVELGCWGGVVMVAFLWDWCESGGEGLPAGWGVSAAWVAAVFLKDRRAAWIDWIAVAVSTLWASQGLGERMGWSAVTLLWTGLGFAWVTAGLWRGLASVRIAGFVLLLGALLKLFFHDVWEFGAFTRVAAFLSLGAALVVLGFFYNRFTGLLRKLVQEE
ncbi:putative membrane protein [Haloferula luteola]|uniref:Putative membrane protein n=1 Tax=Haloferula luteola TaxID=595692 RepID=A0A840V9E8_9BACT|nr:DUF2339 domain-containing protein [Haloferula luteola]MBB5350409.1 putative membrane protein [Haloferula luteola]